MKDGAAKMTQVGSRLTRYELLGTSAVGAAQLKYFTGMDFEKAAAASTEESKSGNWETKSRTVLSTGGAELIPSTTQMCRCLRDEANRSRQVQRLVHMRIEAGIVCG